jgi:hypothetical protein
MEAAGFIPIRQKIIQVPGLVPGSKDG